MQCAEGIPLLETHNVVSVDSRQRLIRANVMSVYPDSHACLYQSRVCILQTIQRMFRPLAPDAVAEDYREPAADFLLNCMERMERSLDDSMAFQRYTDVPVDLETKVGGMNR
jgi:hypothetical protein